MGIFLTTNRQSALGLGGGTLLKADLRPSNLSTRYDRSHWQWLSAQAKCGCQGSFPCRCLRAKQPL